MATTAIKIASNIMKEVQEIAAKAGLLPFSAREGEIHPKEGFTHADLQAVATGPDAAKIKSLVYAGGQAIYAQYKCTGVRKGVTEKGKPYKAPTWVGVEPALFHLEEVGL